MKTRKNKSREKAINGLFNSEFAGATVIAVVLLLCIIIGVLAVVRIEHVPEWKTDAEESHMIEVQSDMAELKSTIDLITLLTSDTNSLAYGFSVTVPFNAGGGAIPVLEPSKSSGTLSVNAEPCNINITIRKSTGSTQVLSDQPLECGGITYHSNNRQYIDQTLRYENGALIISQSNRSLMKQFPSFSIASNQSNENNYTVSIHTINISGDSDTISSDTDASLRVTGLNYTSDSRGPEEIDSFNFTVITKYPDAWYFYLNQVAEDAKLEHDDYNLFYRSNGSKSVLYSVHFEFPTSDKKIEEFYISNAVIQAELGAGSSFKDTSRIPSSGTIKKLPIAGFRFNPQSGCAPVDIQIIDKSQYATNYNYDFGDGTANSTEAAPKHTYAKSGTFTINQTVTNAYGIDSVTYAITVRQRPVADFISDVSEGEIPLTIKFTDTSQYATGGVTWDFGDGSANEIGSIVTHEYTSPGTYTVTLTASNGFETNTTTGKIIAQQLPVARFSASYLSGQVPLYVRFTDYSENTDQWFWNFGDGSVSNAQNPEHTYTQVGVYNATLTVTNEYGQDTMTREITVTPQAPVADFAYESKNGNKPLDISFIDLSTNSPTSWYWDFGDGNTSTLQNPLQSFSKSGKKTVTLTARNSGGASMKTKTFTLN